MIVHDMAPQDLRTVDTRPKTWDDDTAKDVLRARLEARFGAGSLIAQMLGLAESAPKRFHVSSDGQRFQHVRYTCPTCGKQRRGTPGVCQYCKAVASKGLRNRQAVGS